MKMMFIIPGLVLCQTGGLMLSVHARLTASAKPLPTTQPIVANNRPLPYFSSTFQSLTANDSVVAALTTGYIFLKDSVTANVVKSVNDVLAGYTATIDQNGNVLLEWQTAFENNVGFFIIEKSNNGRKFTQHGFLKATGNATTKTAYRFIDLHPKKGTIYYRIKEIKKNLFVKNIGVQKVHLADTHKMQPCDQQQPNAAINNGAITETVAAKIKTGNGFNNILQPD